MDEKIAGLLEDIKRLLILELVEKGTKGKRIAEILEVDPAVVSRIVSGKRAKR